MSVSDVLDQRAPIDYPQATSGPRNYLLISY
jgi:hypothetical protein